MLLQFPISDSEINLNAVYDAVVVGSGAAGGMAAHVLTQHGLKVLMLEAGKQVDTSTSPIGIHGDIEYKGNVLQKRYLGYDAQ